MKSKAWFIYIIETQKGLLYTGITTDPKKRMKNHLKPSKGKGAKFFYLDSPKDFVYLEKVSNRSEATKKELFIKKLSKQEKLELIKKSGPFSIIKNL
ncbi:GIY-YIG nuclease family protein [Bacteriovoracales bacterium]|nr:GIY-YIG nuclease family protein [Bacteriovoracales bacterium]